MARQRPSRPTFLACAALALLAGLAPAEDNPAPGPRQGATSDEPPGASPQRAPPDPSKKPAPSQAPAPEPPAAPGYPPEPPDSAGQCRPSAPVKAGRDGAYHPPGAQDYARTKALRCFGTPEAAQAAGFRPAGK
jgi:hypothetical protein